MALVKTDDHIDQAQGLLIDQYAERPRLAAFLASFSARCQEAEDMLWDVLWKRLIDNAEGHQLDMIGKIVGEPRRDRADNIYRLFVLARIRINWSQGTPNDVIDVVGLVQGSANSFRYREVYPASLEVVFDNDFVETDRGFVAPELELAFASLVRQAREAGMHSMVVVVNEGKTPMQMAYSDGAALTVGAGMVYTDGDLNGGFPAGCYP
jgi:hypothetical protein